MLVQEDLEGLKMNRLSSANYHSMLTRIITALVMCCICIPCFIFGGWAFFILVIVVTMLACYEIVRACSKGPISLIVFLLCLTFTLFLVIGPMLCVESSFNELVNNNNFVIDKVFLPPFVIVLAFVLLFSVGIFSTKTSVLQICYLFTFCLFVGLSLQSALYIRYVPNSARFYNNDTYRSCLLLIYVLMGIVFNDIGAYFIGVLFGKHQMCKRISPHKTWEGFVGGLFFSFAFSFTFAYLMSYYNLPVLPGIIDTQHFYYIIILSIVMPLVSVIGDLLFSSIKRYFGLKDFSNLLPGHGGIMDRLDSVSTTLMVVMVILNFMISGSIF